MCTVGMGQELAELLTPCYLIESINHVIIKQQNNGTNHMFYKHIVIVS